MENLDIYQLMPSQGGAAFFTREARKRFNAPPAGPTVFFQLLMSKKTNPDPRAQLATGYNDDI